MNLPRLKSHPIDTMMWDFACSIEKKACYFYGLARMKRDPPYLAWRGRKIIWSLRGSKAVYVRSQFKTLLATKKGSDVSCRAIEEKDSDPRKELLFDFDDCLYELQRKRTCLTTPILWALFFTLDFTRGKFSNLWESRVWRWKFILHGCRKFL